MLIYRFSVHVRTCILQYSRYVFMNDVIKCKFSEKYMLTPCLQCSFLKQTHACQNIAHPLIPYSASHATIFSKTKASYKNLVSLLYALELLLAFTRGVLRVSRNSVTSDTFSSQVIVSATLDSDWLSHAASSAQQPIIRESTKFNCSRLHPHF